MNPFKMTQIFISICILSFTGIFLQSALAQNFANFMATDDATVPAEEINNIEQQAMADGELTDDEVQAILQLHQVNTSAPTDSRQPTPAATVTTNEFAEQSNTPPPIVPLPMEIGDESTYTLGPTDEIEITVSRHPEVTGRFSINSEGKIQYRFVGDVKVAGMTKSEVTEYLVKILSEYIISPEVTVIITGYNSKIVYVIGEVGGPGKIFMRGDTITVREALVQAGLPLLSANTPKSVVITPADSGKAEQRKVNVHKLLYKGDLRENLVMKPGDTLYIPPTIFAKAMRVMQPVSQPIGTAAGTGRTVMTGF